MPRFLDLEQSHGSVTLGLRSGGASNRSAAGARLFVTLRYGMQTLPTHWRELAEPIQFGKGVQSIVETGKRGQSGAVVKNGEPTGSLSRRPLLLRRACSKMRRLVYPLGFVRSLWIGGCGDDGVSNSDLPRPLDAFGFVVPAKEAHPVMAATFSSVAWADRRRKDVAH